MGMKKRAILVVLAVLAALGAVFGPQLIPATAGSSIDATQFLSSGRLAVAIGVVFLGGFLTSLTPCVYPLIPITVSVFGARQAKSRKEAVALTSAYVAGMGVVFSALGVFAALSGKLFGATLGNSWVAAGLAVFLLILSASMFGAFDIALPSSLTTKLSSTGKGGVVGALLMGSVAGLLAAPCTGPILSSLLAWVSTTRSPALGAMLLFVYALGIGVPFFAIGVFAARLPKGGPWMEWVKSIFGIALIVLAISTLRSAFPGLRGVLEEFGTTLGVRRGLIIVALLVAGGVLLGALHRSFKQQGERLLKTVAVAALVLGFVVRSALPASTSLNAKHGTFSWAMVLKPDVKEDMTRFRTLLEEAKVSCRPVMLDFFADWCAACTELDTHTYVKSEVIGEAERFVSIKVDATEDNPEFEALFKEFGVEGLPTIAFLDGSGKLLPKPRIHGFLEAPEFVAEMQKVTSDTCEAKAEAKAL